MNSKASAVRPMLFEPRRRDKAPARGSSTDALVGTITYIHTYIHTHTHEVSCYSNDLQNDEATAYESLVTFACSLRKPCDFCSPNCELRQHADTRVYTHNPQHVCGNLSYAYLSSAKPCLCQGEEGYTASGFGAQKRQDNHQPHGGAP